MFKKLRKVYEYLLPWKTKKLIESFFEAALWMAFGLAIIAVILSAINFGISKWCDEMVILHPDLEFHYSFWSNCRAKAPNGRWVLAEDLIQYYGELHTVRVGEINE
jgi:hypothetical protein